MPFPVTSVSANNTSAPAVATDPSWAGVSFVFEDAFWCDWLYREFDGLRVPRSLIRRPSRHGLPYPDRLSVSPDPADPVQLENYAETLRTAQHLIVIVSPSSGQSDLMKEHMRAFRAAGGEERIVALIVKGEPGSPIAEPGSMTDREWMPLWLQWRFSEAGFADSERTEPLVVDARMGVATLSEVRSQLLAAMLEVDESQLSELGVISRASTRPSFETASTTPQPHEAQTTDSGGRAKGNGWLAATVAIASACAIGGLVFNKMQRDAEQSARKSPPTAAQTITAKIPPAPVAPQKPVAGAPVVEVAMRTGAESREFQVLVERRDRLFSLAETQKENGAYDEAYDILKQAADIANVAIRKSDSTGPHLLRAAQIAHRLGQLAFRVGTPAESREFFERGRQMILQARQKSAVETDGAALFAELEADLQKLSVR